MSQRAFFFAVIVRLVRNCALERTMQFAAAFRSIAAAGVYWMPAFAGHDERPRQQAGSYEASLSVAFGALKVFRSVGL